MYVCVLALVHLDIQVNISHELETRVVADRGEHQTKHVACEQRVAEELNGLQTAGHVAAFDVEEHCIAKHEQAS